MGHSLALSAALAAAACATIPKSTLPRAPKPPKPTAADYEPARRAVREMRSVRKDSVRMQAIEQGVRQRVEETLEKMTQELRAEEQKALAGGYRLAPVLGSKFGSYPAALRSAFIEHYRGYDRQFREVNYMAGEILNVAGHKEYVQWMFKQGKPIVRYDLDSHRFVLNVEPGTAPETVGRIEKAIKPLAKGFEENTAKADRRIDAFKKGLIDQEVERVDAEAEAKRESEELRKRLKGPK